MKRKEKKRRKEEKTEVGVLRVARSRIDSVIVEMMTAFNFSRSKVLKAVGEVLAEKTKTPAHVYKTSDLILPTLNLGRQVKIRIEMDGENVYLFIGPRDWQWDRKTGKFVGAGTCVGGLVAALNAVEKPVNEREKEK